MSYTYSITSKGQITVPAEFRRRLGLDKLGKATFSLNKQGKIVLEAPKDLAAVRHLLQAQSANDLSDKERAIGGALAKKYGVR